MVLRSSGGGPTTPRHLAASEELRHAAKQFRELDEFVHHLQTQTHLLVPLDNELLMHVERTNLSSIRVNVGLHVYVDMTLQEAQAFARHTQDSLARQADDLEREWATQVAIDRALFHRGSWNEKAGGADSDKG
jgi:prefoldin subunit 5